MPVFEHFIVDKTTKQVEEAHSCNSREYWMKGGDYEGTIDMEIEVFASYNHEEHANKLYESLKAAGLENKYFSVKISVK